MGKVIVNQWFPTLSSEYGNSAQVANHREGIASVIGQTAGQRSHYVTEQVLGLEPLLLVAIALGLLVTLVRRRPAALGTLAVVGGVLAFDIMTAVAGRSFAWLRFDITAVPLTVLLLGHAATGLHGGWRRGLAGVVAFAVALPGVVIAADTVTVSGSGS